MLSNLSIFDLTNNKLVNNANFWDYCPAGRYTNFSGISFVSNLKFVQNNLLPRFANINLVLGLSDNGENPTGKFLEGLMSKRKNDVAFVYDNEALKQRILDGSLNFRFTQNDGALIHNKVYLMTNENEYQAFVGSMNLTDTAVKKNHESLVRFYGQIDDANYQMVKQFIDNSDNWSSSYLDAKHLKGLIGSTKKQTEINFMQDSIDRLEMAKESGNSKNVFVVSSKDELKKMREIGSGQVKGFDDLSKADKIIVKQIVSLAGESGQLRQKKNLQKLGSTLFQIDQVINRIGNDTDHNQKAKIRLDEEMYPSPLMIYNEGGNFMTMGKDVHHQEVIDIKHDLNKDDVAIFPRIVKEYEESKMNGEGHQACDFLLWLFEAPWLWKIRQLYKANIDTATVVDDVPLRVLLVGESTTGKSTLGSKLASRLTRNRDKDVITTGEKEFLTKSGRSTRDKYNLNGFLDGYLKAQGPVSTILVDDIEPSYFSQKYFAQSVRDIGDDAKYLGPRPTVAYSANLTDQQTGKMINTDLAVQRRMYYLAFDSPFKTGYQPVIDQLLSDANNHLYLLVQDKLREFLTVDDMPVEKELKIENDFLYPVKTVLREILEQYDLFDDLLAKFFAENYNFIVDRGRVNWDGLVSSKTYQKQITFSNDGKLANIPRALFNGIAGSNGRITGQSLMKEYYESLPRNAEIVARKSDSGFNIDVANFDKFIGRPILKDLYEQSSGIADDKRQAKIIGTAIAEALDSRDDKKEKKMRHHGLLGLFKRG